MANLKCLAGCTARTLIATLHNMHPAGSVITCERLLKRGTLIRIIGTHDQSGRTVLLESDTTWLVRFHKGEPEMGVYQDEWLEPEQTDVSITALAPGE